MKKNLEFKGLVNGMVHLPKNGTLVHQQLSLHQPHHPHPSQRLTKRFFFLRDVTRLTRYEHHGVRLYSRCEIKDPRNILHPRCNLKDPRNIIHRPEEALDIQFELIFVNAMVHLHPRNETLVHQQLSLHQLHHPHPS